MADEDLFFKCPAGMKSNPDRYETQPLGEKSRWIRGRIPQMVYPFLIDDSAGDIDISDEIERRR